jgi:plastocyanin
MSHGEHVALLNFAVQPGLPVHVTFTNHTQRFHTFTAAGLGVTALIRPAHGSTPTRTTVTFTARKFGVFSWACLLCPANEIGSASAMSGKVYAIMHV